MKLLKFILYSFILISCNNYDYLAPEDFNGVTMPGKMHTHKLKLKIAALSHCKSDLVIYTSKQPHTFSFHGKMDTVIRMDWYSDHYILELSKILVFLRTQQLVFNS